MHLTIPIIIIPILFSNLIKPQIQIFKYCVLLNFKKRLLSVTYSYSPLDCTAVHRIKYMFYVCIGTYTSFTICIHTGTRHRPQLTEESDDVYRIQ